MLPFQDSSPLLNEVSSSHAGTDSQTFASVSKPSSAYPSTTIVNPTIVLLQHNRGKGSARCTPPPAGQNQPSCPVMSAARILPFHRIFHKSHSSPKAACPSSLPPTTHKVDRNSRQRPPCGDEARCLNKQVTCVPKPGYSVFLRWELRKDRKDNVCSLIPLMGILVRALLGKSWCCHLSFKYHSKS